MDTDLFLKIITIFIKHYNKCRFTSDLPSAIIEALAPICSDIETGKYDIKKDK